MNAPTWTDIIQTIAVVGALLYTAFEVRSRRKELRFRNYLDAISGFVELAKLMVEKPELQALYAYSKDDITSDYQSLTPEQKARINYCDSIIALCETIWLADREKWLDGDEWPYWKKWLVELNQSAEFRWAVEWVKGDYAPDFINEIRGT